MSRFWFEPNWPAPAGVRAISTSRRGGVSSGAYASLNLGGHVGDDPDHVGENRRRLREELGLPSEPVWLNQVHGARAVWADNPDTLDADASVTGLAGVVCAVMTADCLPILLCDRDGRQVAAIHAGWRGLAEGIVEAAVDAFGGGELLAWLGPAIGPDAFEVGDEVRAEFADRHGAGADCFKPRADGRWSADLYGLARLALGRRGVERVYGGDRCTFSEPEHFFSYRRDGQTGRMATLIWRE